MQPSGASHRLFEAYCQRPADCSCPAAHAAFHDVFFRGEPSARCGRSGRASCPGCRREPPRRAKLGRPAQVVVPGGGFLALASTVLPEVRGIIIAFSWYLCAGARTKLSWVVTRARSKEEQEVYPKGRALRGPLPRAMASVLFTLRHARARVLHRPHLGTALSVLLATPPPRSSCGGVHQA